MGELRMNLKNIGNLLSLGLAMVLAIIGLTYLIGENYFMFAILLIASGVWFIELRVNMIYQKMHDSTQR